MFSDIGMEKLRSIMRDWPREDYEFQYDFCTWKDIERELIKPGKCSNGAGDRRCYQKLQISSNGY